MLDIIGLVFLIVFTVFVYKTARDYNRNAFGWALITIAVGIFLQIIFPLLILIAIIVIANVGGSSVQEIYDTVPLVTINIVFKVLSIAACFLILRHLATIQEEKPFDLPPQPPTDFN